MKSRNTILAWLAIGALAVAACGEDSGAETSTTQPEVATTQPEVATTIESEMTETTEAEMMESSIVDVAASNEDFFTLVAAVQAAGLVDALADPDATLTVFAPTNEAFDAALEALGTTAEDLFADTETLTAILTYHVLGSEVTSADIAAAGVPEIPVEPLSGEDLVVALGDDGSVGFADQAAKVITTDIDASNGVIHVIDAVLLPPSLQG